MDEPVGKNFDQPAHSVISAVMELMRNWPRATTRAAIVAVALIIGWHTWGRWGDFQMDCGRELYVPLEILRGKLLYRDMWYPYGPLGPYLAAFLIALFGKHFYVLYLLGFASTIGSALLLFEIGAMLEGSVVGAAAALALLFQGFGPSSFNYIFPWSYAGSLGMLLSLMFACSLLRHVLGRPGHNLMRAGLLAGLALLCKQEFGAACYVSLAFALAWEALAQRSMRTVVRGVFVCAPGFALAVAVYGWFFWTLTPHFMVQDNWIGLPGTYFARRGGPELYEEVGFRPEPKQWIGVAFDAAAALFVWCLIARTTRATSASRFVVVAALAAVGLAVTRQFSPLAAALIVSTFIFPIGMFFVVCVFIAYALYQLSRQPQDRHWLAGAAFGIFALASASRVFARILPYGYSIFYNAPLFLLFIIALNASIGVAVPGLAGERRRKVANSLLAAMIILLAIGVIPSASLRTARLETSWGPMYLRPAEAHVARQILDFVAEQKLRDRSVLLLPELPMIYALTGTEAGNRWYTIIPGALSPAMEDDYIANLKRHQPDYIVLTDRYTSEYGLPYFGIDYDRKIYQWMETNYAVVRQFGDFRRDGVRRLAAQLYRRRGLIAAAQIDPALVWSRGHRLAVESSP
jgi:hypothetical protein